jgi:hypothetical protein
MPYHFIIPFYTSQASARHVGCLRISRSKLTGVRAKPRKKTAALELPPMPQLSDKVYPPNYEMVYEISKVHCGGDEIDLQVSGTNLERFRVRTDSVKFVERKPPARTFNPFTTPEPVLDAGEVLECIAAVKEENLKRLDDDIDILKAISTRRTHPRPRSRLSRA